MFLEILKNKKKSHSDYGRYQTDQLHQLSHQHQSLTGEYNLTILAQ